MYGDYYLSAVTLNNIFSVAQLNAIVNATHILGSVDIQDSFCRNNNFANKSDALNRAFSRVREIHGYLSVGNWGS